MAYEQREGYISIFANKNRKSDKSPSHRGTAKLNGQELEIALWVKEGKGGRFFAGKIKPKQDRQQQLTANDDPFA